MGIIRLILAISVVFSHTIGFLIVGGDLAVRLFYMISGFLISYVLNESSSYKNPYIFYKNRLLRLFPVYWLVVVLVIFVYILEYAFLQSNKLFAVWNQMPASGWLPLFFSNIFIFGQDWLMFTAVNSGDFGWALNFRDTEVEIWQGLLVPQAWSLGVELSFYLIAPFVLKNKIILWTLFFSSAAIKIFLYQTDWGSHDPWDHRFFPAELCMFLAGALSQQYLLKFYKKVFIDINKISKWITLIFFFYVLLFFIFPKNWRPINSWVLIFSFVMALPFMFLYQSENKIDAKIGNLSYPVYISHMLCIFVVDKILSFVQVSENKKIFLALFSVALSVFVAIFIEKFYSPIFEIRRSKIKDLGAKQ